MTESTQPLQGYEHYLVETFAAEDDALLAARADMKREGLPDISVSASEGKLLHLLARMIGAKRVLEIGTLGGYSTIWLARALPADGKVVTLELDAHHADVARRNLERAGQAAKVEVRVGPALESLAKMETKGEAPFDLVFIDAEKDGYVGYLAAAEPLLRTGGLLLADNTLPDAVLDPAGDSGTKRYNAAVAARSDLVTTILPTLRLQGIDGLTVSIKTKA